MKVSNKIQFLWALFFLGLMILNYPFLDVYNTKNIWWGIPAFYLVLFFNWLLIILLVYLTVKKINKDTDA